MELGVVSAGVRMPLAGAVAVDAMRERAVESGEGRRTRPPV